MTSSVLSLRQQQHPLICQLADAIERIWEDKLVLDPYSIPKDLGYIESHLEGERLIIENRCYQTPQFRKIHLELAQIGNGLDILHCVMFPHSSYSLPMFGCDIVGARGNISAAIVDLSPIQTNKRLPNRYYLALSQLPNFSFKHHRELPDWGDIFSSFCTFIRPVNHTENQAFLQRVQYILRIHCNIANKTQPVCTTVEKEEIIAGQAYYCSKQRKNDKTRYVLERSFGPEWTERYMSTMLFDTIAV
ncbi:MAG: phycocyanobilin:ferredoxin oxidoreductase [Cyanobacteria bacterium P01_F01_bin.150]